MQLPLRDVNCYATWNERCVKQKRKNATSQNETMKKTFGVLENQISFCILMSIVIVKVIAIVVDELL